MTGRRETVDERRRCQVLLPCMEPTPTVSSPGLPVTGTSAERLPSQRVTSCGGRAPGQFSAADSGAGLVLVGLRTTRRHNTQFWRSSGLAASGQTTLFLSSRPSRFPATWSSRFALTDWRELVQAHPGCGYRFMARCLGAGQDYLSGEHKTGLQPGAGYSHVLTRNPGRALMPVV